MATSKDIAKMVGVSHTTVSRAFRGDVKVKPETYNRIMEAAKKLNYTPNFFASNLKQSKSNLISLIIPDITNPFFMEISKRLYKQLEEQGYRLLLFFDGYDVDVQERQINTLLSMNVGAVVFGSLNYRTPPSFVKMNKKNLIEIFGNRCKKFNSVSFDDFYGAYIGTKYLLDKNHTKIMVIGGDDRKSGYQKAFNEYNVKPIYCDVSDLGTPEEIRDRVIEQINIHNPTAVFSLANKVSRGVYDAAKKLNLCIPDDISLLYYDDQQWAEMLGITVVSHPHDEFVDNITRMILAQINGEKLLEHKKLNPFIIERNSVSLK